MQEARKTQVNKHTTMVSQKKSINIRKSYDRGHAHHGWLDTHHTFSFANYFDPRYEQFGALRVLNEDVVTAGYGFGMHGHRDYEIYSYVVSGELEHRDSIGNVETLKRGDVQMTSAGTGIRHSEYNRHRSLPVHFLQIWVKPNRSGLTPEYQTKHFSNQQKLNNLCQIVAPKNSDNSAIHINQNFSCYASMLEAGKQVSYNLDRNRLVYVHVVNKKQADHGLHITVGSEQPEEVQLTGGDGAFIDLKDLVGDTQIRFRANDNAETPVEFLVFDTI